MDPSARLLLQSSYEALENAGIPQESVKKSNTGCYVGCFTDDWKHLQTMDSEHAPMHSGTGTGFSLLAARISHYYDIRGPSVTVDTACSSSLVALNLACQSLKSGESDMALVCGVNLILAPNVALWYSSLRMLSPDGVSRSFAHDAKGYGRGEGVAAIVLKPLSRALRDGDTIRAVIKGTLVNQDGRSYLPKHMRLDYG
jgi:acyl transferase domain-containing protein